MSFLTRTAIARAGFASQASYAGARAFSAGFVARKTAADSVKDTVKGVDRAVSDKLVDGIEIGR